MKDFQFGTGLFYRMQKNATYIHISSPTKIRDFSQRAILFIF